MYVIGDKKITQNQRHIHIRRKFLEDQAHIQYLMKNGWHLLDIADQMIHYELTLFKDEIISRHPDWNEEQIRDEMKKKILKQKLIKIRRKSYGN